MANPFQENPYEPPVQAELATPQKHSRPRTVAKEYIRAMILLLFLCAGTAALIPFEPFAIFWLGCWAFCFVIVSLLAVLKLLG